MTTHRQAAISDPDAPASAIRDRGYTRYDGPRLPPRRRFRVVAGRCLALAWRSNLVKTAMILGLIPVIVCAVVMFFKLQAARMMPVQAGGPSLALLDNPQQWVFHCMYWCQLWFAFCISLLTAAPAIADDIKTGAFHFYLSRPLTPESYLLGKVIGAGALILILVGAPGVLLSVLRIALARDGSDALAVVPLLPYTIGYALLYTAAVTIPAVALSTLSSKSGQIIGGWAALFFFPWVLGDATAAAADIPYAALISLPTTLRIVGQHIYGIAPSYGLSWIEPAIVLAAIIGGSMLLLWSRLRKVEVLA